MREPRSEKKKLADMVRGLLGSGFEGSQEEIRDHLAKHGYSVTQSTVSRTLRKLEVSRNRKQDKIVYRLPVEKKGPRFRGSLQGLIMGMTANESMIVIRTTPGTAMFVAAFLDQERPERILGTIAGDDTIFVAPTSTEKISSTIKSLRRFFSSKHMTG